MNTTPKYPERNPHFRQRAIAAAYFESRGWTRTQIAAHLNCGEPTVAKLIQFAREHGYLSYSPTFLRHNVSDTDWSEVEKHYLISESLTELLSPFVPDGLYFDAKMYYGDYPNFVRAAAVAVRQLLRRTERLGVMWGRTVHLLVDCIQTFGDHAASAATQIECIPLCGDPTYLMNQRPQDYSATWMATDLERALRHPAHVRQVWPSLSNVPAYLSRAVRTGLRRNEVGWGSFLHQIPGYQAILARPLPGRRAARLADTVDTVIMGAGIVAPDAQPLEPGQPVGPTTGDFIEERVQQEKISKADLAKLIYGDIGGWLLERPHLKPADQKLVRELNDGWTGLTEENLKAIAAKGSDKGGTGAILVAAGAAKAELILEAIRRGLVNQLMVDETLKHELVSLIERTE